MHPRRVERDLRRAAPRGPASRCAPGRRRAGTARRPTRRRAGASRPRPRAGDARTAPDRCALAIPPPVSTSDALTARGLHVDQPGDEPGGDRGRELVGVAVDQDGRSAPAHAGQLFFFDGLGALRPSLRCASSRARRRPCRTAPPCASVAFLTRGCRHGWRRPAFAAAADRLVFGAGVALRVTRFSGSRQIKVRIGGRSVRSCTPVTTESASAYDWSASSRRSSSASRSPSSRRFSGSCRSEIAGARQRREVPSGRSMRSRSSALEAHLDRRDARARRCR